jgi:hypothetical protein
MAKGPWDVKFEEIDTAPKVLGLAVAAVAAVCLAWLALADSAIERGIAGGLVILCIAFLAVMLTRVAGPATPSTAVGATTVQVAQSEVAEQTQGTKGDQVVGPDGSFYVDRPPSDWKMLTLTMREFVAEELGTSDEVLVNEAAGAWPDSELLVMRSPSVATLKPIPGRTKCWGRVLYSALINDIKLQFVVIPISRAQAPLFFSNTLEDNFIKSIGPFSFAGVTRLTRLESGRARDTGKRQWFAEFEQQLEDIEVNGAVSSSTTIRNSLWVVEGDIQDYFLRLTHTEVLGADADAIKKYAKTLSELAESFRPLGLSNKDSAAERAQRDATARYDELAGRAKSSLLLQELVVAITRFGGRNLDDPDVLLDALRQFEVFARWHEAGDLDFDAVKGDAAQHLAALFQSLQSAGAGDLSQLKGALKILVEDYYDAPAIRSAEGLVS